GSIADANWSRFAIPLPVIEVLVRNLVVAFDRQERGQRHIRMEVLGCIILDPIDESRGFFSEADAERAIDRERRIPWPGVTVIPVANTTNNLGQAGGGSSNDGSRGFER